jgi:integrative and conjugative element protein (TIGR02256 family)
MVLLMQGKALCLRSDDGRFGIELRAKHVTFLVAECQKARNEETGGILIGHYSPDHAMAFVTEVTSAPIDSKRGATWFDRGVQGLKDKLRTSWRKAGTFYLGEWHFHPGAAPNPSHVDSSQMANIARSPEYSCPEPILLIVGGDEKQRNVAGFVYEKGTQRVALSVFDKEKTREGEQNGESSGPSLDGR